MPRLQGLRSRLRAAEAKDDPLAGVDDRDQDIIRHALPFTMTGVARLQALLDAVRYVEARRIRGSFVECGVWRGGSALAMLLGLRELGVEDRDVYLYDTFTGMTAPTPHDVSIDGESATATWESANRRDERAWSSHFAPDRFDQETVEQTLGATGYPKSRLHVIPGAVEKTIPDRAPSQIALLRLDTDWYESTRHELEHLYPRLEHGGVLLVDDYGHWEGARRAVDEYFSAERPLLLTRIDYTGRVAVKA